MSQVTIPFNLTNGTVADASQVMANLAAILAVLNGGIDGTNIPAGANIPTSRLASDAGIVAAMLAPAAVTTPKLAIGAAFPTIVPDPAWASAALSGIAETTLRTTNITTVHGPVIVAFATLSSIPFLLASSFTVRLKIGATVVAFQNLSQPAGQSVGVTLIGLAAGLSIGAHAVTVTGQVTLAGGVVLAGTTGYTTAIELA